MLYISRDLEADDDCGDFWSEPPERSEGDCERLFVGEGFMGTINAELLAALRPDLYMPAPGQVIAVPEAVEETVKPYAIHVAKDTREELDELMKCMGWQRIVEVPEAINHDALIRRLVEALGAIRRDTHCDVMWKKTASTVDAALSEADKLGFRDTTEKE